MIKRMIAVAAVAGLVGAPGTASADTGILAQSFCTASAFSVCVDFDLLQVGANTSKNYRLSMTYVSVNAPVGQQGYMTKLGLYSLEKKGGGWVFDNLALFSTPGGGQTWAVGDCGGLSGGGSISLLACASEDEGPIKGIEVGQTLAFSFTSNNFINASHFTSADGLGVRSHVQALGERGCSLKPDARQPGNVVGGVDEVNATCGTPPPTSTVPEPISMVLLGSGLLGVGAARRRRRNGEVSDD